MSSSIVITSPKLRVLCETKLEKIKKLRDREVEKYLEQRLEAINGHWWRRLLKRFVTKEQIADMEFQHLWEIRNIYYGLSERTALNLLEVCRTSDQVKVSVEDYMRIR